MMTDEALERIEHIARTARDATAALLEALGAAMPGDALAARVTLGPDDVLALIARLRAAEVVCEAARTAHSKTCPSSYCYCPACGVLGTALAAWRATKGGAP